MVDWLTGLPVRRGNSKRDVSRSTARIWAQSGSLGGRVPLSIVMWPISLSLYAREQRSGRCATEGYWAMKTAASPMATIGQTLLIFALVNMVFNLAAAIALRGLGG